MLRSMQIGNSYVTDGAVPATLGPSYAGFRDHSCDARPAHRFRVGSTLSMACCITRTLAAAALFALPGLAVAADSTARTRTFRFTYRAVVNNIPAGAGAVDVWVPFPQSDANQTIRDVSV